ncbi:AIR synthase family protein [Halopenitus persicus]|uniref:Hydrogenase expression/formation protein HypE n=1 Tax=Halopenitus persicus TaxID=1048396 RepID=A0A1H3EJ49_9EURY|nr:AIR synthase family protein [Halopenitus persicus]QHS17560.1 hydrogenase expression protein [haloarchaeon 3A1-DGR]SDX77949.1 hydrogenase expression/formation protein HypE [Halopenitus persicus]
MTGKLDPAGLADFLGAVGAADPAVIQGAAYGEDAAAIDLGDRTLVVSADPISLAAERAGQLGIHVACNDVAVSGADPRWVTSTVFLPDEDPETRRTLADQLDATASDLGVAIVGGHTEYLPALDRPLLSMTAMGTTDRFLPSGGATPGDRLVLTKGAGIEATAILASDFAEECRNAGVETETLETALGFFDDVSVVPEAAAIRELATAMHDPTEGGLLTAVHEMASAAGVRVEIAREDVPIRPETRACCAAMGVDPLRTFGSGALLAAVPADRVAEAVSAVESIGVEAAAIGEVVADDAGTGSGDGADEVDAGTVVLDGTPILDPPRDDMYALWEAAGDS